MFIKVITLELNPPKDLASNEVPMVRSTKKLSERTMECEDMKVEEIKSDGCEKDKIVLILHNGKGQKAIQEYYLDPCREFQVILMNNEGKTIDRHIY